MLQRLFAVGLLAAALVMPVHALAQVKVSARPSASTLAGTEVAPVVQSGATVKATVDQYAARARTVITGQANTWTGAQSMNTPLAVTSGGTGAATVPAAVAALGAAPGRAVLSPKLVQTTSQSDPWNAFDPWGQPINCSGTTSQCLQEFITATAANGWPAEVHCQGTHFPALTEPVFLNVNAPINVPVAQDWSFYADATCNLNINATNSSGLILDSQGASSFVWDGKIVYQPSAPNGNVIVNPSCAVLLKPHTNTQDGFAAIYAGHLRIKSPVTVPGSGTATGVICVDLSAGQVIQEDLSFNEINGDDATYHGLFIYGATVSNGFQQNHVYANQVHGLTLDGVNEGYSSSHAANYRNNIWVLENIQMTSPTSRAVDAWGANDQWQVGRMDDTQGGLQYGVVAESTAANNLFQYGGISGANTSDVLDGGTGNVFVSASVSGLFRSAALKTTPLPVGSLPTCNAGADGLRAFVTDANATTFASAVANGGANHLPVYCDGPAAAWKIG